METLAVQPEYANQHELQRRYDLETQFAELVDGTMRTNFNLHLAGNDLISDDGRSLDKTTGDALQAARETAKTNPALWFEVRRRGYERDEFDELLMMARGQGPNTMVVVSDFPPELMDAQQDIGGYNVTRQQTMLRVLTRRPDGTIRMSSQSLDGSNRAALEAIYARFNLRPHRGELLGQRIWVDLDPDQQANLADELTGVYDRSLTRQFGGQWYAGRRPSDIRNTYDFVRQQHDLIGECIRLDGLGWLNEKILYDMAATMNQRFRQPQQQARQIVRRPNMIIDHALLYQEIDHAGTQARQAGRSFSACGMTLGAGGVEAGQLEQAGYGGKSREELSWHGGTIKSGVCVNCKKHTKVGVANWCKACIKC